MATILIKPVHTKSANGYSVTIDGVDPTDPDCIHGTVMTPGAGTIEGRWNLNGTMRGGVPDCNLDVQDANVADVAALARVLGAPSA